MIRTFKTKTTLDLTVACVQLAFVCLGALLIAFYEFYHQPAKDYR